MLNHHDSRRGRSVAIALATSASALLGACSDGNVDLGEGLVAQDFARGGRCAESTRITGDVFVANQAELDQLAGCEEVTGSLRIQIFEGADLSPLEALRAVGEVLALGDTPVPFPEDPAEQEAIWALEEAGYLESLHGLESLESAGSLLLISVLVEDLTELQSITTIRNGLLVNRTKNLVSFAGLERVLLSDLTVFDSPALETLAGLRLRDSSGGVIIQSAPALNDVQALAGLGIVNGVFMLSGTGVASLPDLGQFSATQIFIENNPALVDLSGLGGLQGVVELQVAGNPSLRNFPALPELRSFDVLAVLGNAAIESLVLEFPLFEQTRRLLRDREVPLSVTQIEIGSNANLRQITSPPATTVQYFSIYGNASLTDLDLGALERADLLSIADNPVLASLDAENLATVDVLEVTDNPLLAPDLFDDVQTFTRQIDGNAPSAP